MISAYEARKRTMEMEEKNQLKRVEKKVLESIEQESPMCEVEFLLLDPVKEEITSLGYQVEEYLKSPNEIGTRIKW